jgi:hypothetical protein
MTIDNVPTISKENGEEVVRYLNNVPRGIRERGLWKEGLRGKCQKAKGTKGSPCETKSCCAETLLANQPDFLEQECQIAEIVKAGGHLCLFLHKYHCELNIIEFFWGAMKNHTRECCDFTLDGLDREIRIAQEKVKIATIRRWYHRMMRWVDAHETGAGTVTAQQQVQEFSSKKLKSHRRAPEDDGTKVVTFFSPSDIQPIGPIKLRFIQTLTFNFFFSNLFGFCMVIF